jgi:hypothetical protein
MLEREAYDNFATEYPILQVQDQIHYPANGIKGR